ncbi:hypothetical protein FKM82_021874 [Ascaphus truei]
MRFVPSVGSSSGAIKSYLCTHQVDPNMCSSQALTPTPWISPVVSRKALFSGPYSSQCSSMIFLQLVREPEYTCMQMTQSYMHTAIASPTLNTYFNLTF